MSACDTSQSENAAKHDRAMAADATVEDDADASTPPRALTGEDLEFLEATDFEIAFERTACLGACPVYALRIGSNGDVRFIGYLYVDKPGVYDTSIPADRARSLYEQIIRSGFLGFRSKYAPDSGCTTYRTDNPHSV